MIDIIHLVGEEATYSVSSRGLCEPDLGFTKRPPTRNTCLTDEEAEAQEGRVPWPRS